MASKDDVFGFNNKLIVFRIRKPHASITSPVEAIINADMYVRQILSTTIVARLGDDPNILEISKIFMGVNTKKILQEIESFLER